MMENSNVDAMNRYSFEMLLDDTRVVFSADQAESVTGFVGECEPSRSYLR